MHKNILIIGSGNDIDPMGIGIIDYTVIKTLLSFDNTLTIHTWPKFVGIGTQNQVLEDINNIDELYNYIEVSNYDLILCNHEIVEHISTKLGITRCISLRSLSRESGSHSGFCKEQLQNISNCKLLTKQFCNNHCIPTAAWKCFDTIPNNENLNVMIESILNFAPSKNLIVTNVINSNDNNAVSKSIYPNNGIELRNFITKHNTDKILIEKRLHGRNFSVTAFCDGQNTVVCPPIQVISNSSGSVGAYGPITWIPLRIFRQAQYIVQRTIHGLGFYRGIMTVKFMFVDYDSDYNIGSDYDSDDYDNSALYQETNNTDELHEIYVLSFHCGFQDPECQTLLTLLNTNLCNIFIACLNGTLGDMVIQWKSTYCVTLIASIRESNGNTYNPRRSLSITGNLICNNNSNSKFISIPETSIYIYYYNALTESIHKRILSIVSLGPSLRIAQRNLYNTMYKNIYFNNRPPNYRKNLISNNDEKINIAILCSSSNATFLDMFLHAKHQGLFADIHISIVISNCNDPIYKIANNYHIYTYCIESTNDCEVLHILQLAQPNVQLLVLIDSPYILTKNILSIFPCIAISGVIAPEFNSKTEDYTLSKAIKENQQCIGCTIHAVNSNTPMTQKLVNVTSGDTIQTLKYKLQQTKLYCIEHVLYEYVTHGLHYFTKPLIYDDNVRISIANQKNIISHNNLDHNVVMESVDEKFRAMSSNINYDIIGNDVVVSCINTLMSNRYKPLLISCFTNLKSSMNQKIIYSVQKSCKKYNIIFSSNLVIQQQQSHYDQQMESSNIIGIGFGKKQCIPKQLHIIADVLLGVGSNYINNHDIVMKCLGRMSMSLDSRVPWDLSNNNSQKLVDVIFDPMVNYNKLITKLWKTGKVKSIIHVQDSGLLAGILKSFINNNQNLLDVCLHYKYINKHIVPKCYQWIQYIGQISDENMYNLFNMGIGLVIVIDSDYQHDIMELFTSLKMGTFYEIGYLQ